MKITCLVFAATAILLVFTLTGCSDDERPTSQSDSQVQIIAVTPADGQQNVSRDIAISLVFDMPMDTMSVMSGFHLSGGEQMHEWMDSLEHHHSMGNMGVTGMGHMIDWLEEFECDGLFHWDEGMDSCEFIPDSMLLSESEYMIFLFGDVRSDDGVVMDMHHLEYDGYMVHFKTKP
jgi:hypothetical protein